MIDVRVESIIYQSQIYYRNLINTLVAEKKLGKAYDLEWDKADTILGYIEALNYRDRLTEEEDLLDVNYILECLIKLCDLNQYPVSAPIEFQEPPDVIVGEQGPPGPSVTGPQGPAGLATDFQISLVSVPTVIDSFDITDAKAARWDYIVIESTGEQRAGTIIGHWLPDGSSLELADSSAEDLGVGSTDPLIFGLEFLGGNVRLIATPSSGIWSVIGTRYFIPNNGNGSGPISDVLTNGRIYIGNASNEAQERTVSGVINITNTGVTSFVAGSIVNADVSNTAAIALTKLAALPTGNKVLLSNGTGQIIESTVTNVNLASLDTTTSIQNALNSKLTDPMTTIGDIIIRNGLNVTARLGAGANGTVLTMSGGLPAWAAAPGGISGLTTGFIPKASSATSLANSIISETTGAITIAGTGEIQGGFRTQAAGPYLKVVIVEIIDWNIVSSITKVVAHGLTYSKIRGILDIMIRDDSDTVRLCRSSFYGGQTTPLHLTTDATNITISGTTGLQTTDWDSTGGYVRGWISILYEA